MASIWSETAQRVREYPVLQSDKKVEAAVIGGGLAGILTAFQLQARGVDVIVLEADRIGSGQTKNTTAKITSQHHLVYSKLSETMGEEKTRQYAMANEQAIREYRRIIQEQKIDCAFEESCAYLYSQSRQAAETLEREAQAAFRMGICAEFTEKTQLPFSAAGAVRFDGQAQFHPLRFLYGIAENLTVFEHTRVISVREHRIETERAAVTAEHIVFASHFPFVNFPGFYFARMHQERSYVLALENAPELQGMYLGIGEDALSFRLFQKTLLLGGGSHRTGENPGGKYGFLCSQASRLFPQSRVALHWSAQDCTTLDGVPYIGRFSRLIPDWYVATGFGKWGMTGSMAAAMLLADQITGRENPCAEVFSPLRFTPAASAKTFFIDMAHAVRGITKRVFDSAPPEFEMLAAGQGKIISYRGQKLGAYKHETGKIYTVSVRCPHLGCQLAWNPDEKSWDCPCHGSRFDYQGRLLDNPAQQHLQGDSHET